MTREIVAKPKKGCPQRRPSRKATPPLQNVTGDRGELSTKYAVFIQTRDGREDLRLYSESDYAAALERFIPPMMAVVTKRPVPSSSRLWFDVAEAMIYKIDCVNGRTARRSIIEGRAELIADARAPLGLMHSVVENLFETLN